MKHHRVVLADSRGDVLGSVHSLFAGLFETVLTVANEPALVDAIAKFQPELVVMDLSLPGAEEVNVARRLKTRGPLMDAGVRGVVLRRSAATDLVPAIQEALYDRVYVSPALRGP